MNGTTVDHSSTPVNRLTLADLEASVARLETSVAEAVAGTNKLEAKAERLISENQRLHRELALREKRLSELTMEVETGILVARELEHIRIEERLTKLFRLPGRFGIAHGFRTWRLDDLFVHIFNNFHTTDLDPILKAVAALFWAKDLAPFEIRECCEQIPTLCECANEEVQ